MDDIKIFVDTDDDVRIIRQDQKRAYGGAWPGLDSVDEQYRWCSKTDVPPVHQANQTLCGRDHSWGRDSAVAIDSHSQDWEEYSNEAREGKWKLEWG